jgi:tRNA threonylcarbamoyladenosine biosynthesis protein TsaB
MKILAIDTSTLTAGVAVLLDDGRVIERRARVTTHSEMLMGLVDAAVRDAGIAPAAVDAIACGAGPGSFTGLRIGLATSKGLCFATGRPLIMISSLATLASRAPEGEQVCATLDAYKNEIYAGVYRVQGGLPSALIEETVLPPAALAEELRGYGPMWIVGEGAHRYPELLEGHRRLDDDPSPRPGDLARLAQARLERGETDDLATAAPRYIRLSEPEMLKLKRDKLTQG